METENFGAEGPDHNDRHNLDVDDFYVKQYHPQGGLSPINENDM